MSLLPLFFPRLCPLCHHLLNEQGQLGLCLECYQQLELFSEENSLVTLASGTLAASAGPYLGLLSALIKQLKFYQNIPAAKVLAAVLARQNCTRYLLTSADIIVPVPISGRRRLERGFNQCELILAMLAKEQPLKVNYRVMQREHRTAQHTLDKALRAKNARGAFAVKTPQLLIGKTVTIFDDVMTTQATAEAMVEVIAGAGAKEVRVVTLARTL